MRLTLLALALACTSAGLPAIAATSPEAYIYLSASNGIYIYNASSTGALTPIKGSPFQTAGMTVGTNGKYFVAFGADNATLLSYEIASTGAIDKLVSTINTQLYGGSQCGTISAAKFDHTGENVYVELSGANDGECDGVQTFGLSKSGSFTFKGDTELQEGDEFWSHLPSVTGNGKFAYGFQFSSYDNYCGPSVNLFQAGSQQVLQYVTGNGYAEPPTPPGYAYWVPVPALANDPTDHTVLAMYTTSDGDCEDSPTFGDTQLMSFTANDQGTLVTTNTYKNMPVTAAPTSMLFNSAGNILAVTASSSVQFYHFNGAAPLVKFAGIKGSGSSAISQIGWDSKNHLYAVTAAGAMHVYAVTSTSVKELSPSLTVPNGQFIVRSNQ